MHILRHIPILILIPGLAAALVSYPALASFDQDNDGINDANDNCILISNPQQYDSNSDGIGNLCDADLNNDGIVNDTDIDFLIQFYLSNNLDADLDGDGQISGLDLNILVSRIGLPPGPFGVDNFRLYDRPRILATESVLTQLATRLSDYLSLANSYSCSNLGSKRSVAMRCP